MRVGVRKLSERRQTLAPIRTNETYETHAKYEPGPVSPMNLIGPIGSQRRTHADTPIRRYADTPPSPHFPFVGRPNLP
jgi:hypothetical protein